MAPSTVLSEPVRRGVAVSASQGQGRGAARGRRSSVLRSAPTRGVGQRRAQRPASRGAICCRASAADDDFDPDEDGCEVEEEEEDELHPGFSFGRVFPLEPVRGSVTLPCLAFESEELLLPGHTRTVHLHEARHLALLDEALLMCDKRLCLTAMEVIYAQGACGTHSFLSHIAPPSLALVCHSLCPPARGATVNQ